MTDEAEDEGSAQETGEVYLYWRPHGDDGKTHDRERITDVARVEVDNVAALDDYDQGDLVLHCTDGTAVFDRNELRGFRARGAVEVPEYEQQTDAADEGDGGGE